MIPSHDTRGRTRLSVVILTRNEEARLPRCLESVRWADELIIVDGMSTDRTVELAEAAGARVVRRPFSGSFAEERNAGRHAATGDWVLHLDADDVVTPKFRRAAEALLRRDAVPEVAFKYRRKSVLLGRVMRHGGWHHYIPNLVRRDVRYEGLVHERPILNGPIGVLDADVEHHPCDDLTTFLDRHNRYTSLQAEELVAARGPFSEAQLRELMRRRPWKTFWKTYVKKGGWREGLHGLVFSWFYAGIELIKWAKVWERSHVTPPGAWPPTRDGRPLDPPADVTRPANRPTLAIVMMTKNEERRLGPCLDYVAGWADEIVIIDDDSTDRTVEIARRYTDRVAVMACEDNHDRQWNRGSDLSTADWILHIDADEVVTPALRAAIDRALADPQGHSAFELVRQNVFLGRTMRHGGWRHRHLILFRRDRARCTGQAIHVKLQVDGTVGFIDEEILHFPFESLTQFIQRQNHYSAAGIEELRAEAARAGARGFAYQILWRPVKLFSKAYVKREGRRDGLCGDVFARLFAFFHGLLWAKLWQHTRDSSPTSAPTTRPTPSRAPLAATPPPTPRPTPPPTPAVSSAPGAVSR
jgi:glycosyltransferase involved in cell wall biosynthesis